MQLDFMKLIESKGYISVSKELARNIGLHETMILTELISKYNYFKDKGQLDKEGFFFCTVDDLEHETTINKYYQNKAITNLKKMNLIQYEVKGLPAKRYFKINEFEIMKLFFNTDGNDTENTKNKPKNVDEARHDQEVKYSPTRNIPSEQQEGHPVNSNKNNNKNNKTEEEEQLSTGTLSTEIKNKYQLIFNRQLSAEFEKELLSIFDDENIINYCLSLAEKNSDKPSYLITVLQDWKNEGLNTIEEIKEYQLQRKEENKKKYKRYNTDTEIEIDKNLINEVKSALKQRTGLEFPDRKVKELFKNEDDYTVIIKAIGTLNNKDLSKAVTKNKILQILAIRVKEISIADRSYNKGYR